jgi:hypothetical protein
MKIAGKCWKIEETIDNLLSKNSIIRPNMTFS